jgi:hypothetical protein
MKPNVASGAASAPSRFGGPAHWRFAIPELFKFLLRYKRLQRQACGRAPSRRCTTPIRSLSLGNDFENKLVGARMALRGPTYIATDWPSPRLPSPLQVTAARHSGHARHAVGTEYIAHYWEISAQERHQILLLPSGRRGMRRAFMVASTISRVPARLPILSGPRIFHFVSIYGICM